MSTSLLLLLSKQKSLSLWIECESNLNYHISLCEVSNFNFYCYSLYFWFLNVWINLSFFHYFLQDDLSFATHSLLIS